MHGELYEAPDHRATLVEAELAPCFKSLTRPGEHAFDLVCRVERALEDDTAVDRRNRSKTTGHAR